MVGKYLKFSNTWIGILLILYFSLFIFQNPILAISSSDTNRIFVQYQIWYTTDDILPETDQKWAAWSQFQWHIVNAQDPTHFISPWRRLTSSRLGLPLTGPYSSQTDLDVVRYHLIQAKKAGIDGMFAGMTSGGWISILSEHLKISQSVGMPIGAELYYGTDVDRVPFRSITWKNYGQIPMQANGCTIFRNYQIDWLTQVLQSFKDHPGYLRIDGKPVIWLANYPHTNYQTLWADWFAGSDCPPRQFYAWGDVTEFSNLLSTVEQRIGEPVYVVLTGQFQDNQTPSKKYTSLPQVLRIITGGNIAAFWNKFGYDNQTTVNLNSSNRPTYENYYQTIIDDAVSQGGDKFAMHVYPGFDERGLFPTNLDRQSGVSNPRAVITRSGNGLYDSNDGFLGLSLDKAKAANNRWVFLESWNDYQEQHQIEPAFHFNNFSSHQDPFSPLRRVAAFKGITNPNFDYPPKEILDPPLITYCRYKQFTGGKVRLKGKFGFLTGMQNSNGVGLALSYINDDVSIQNPSSDFIPFNWTNLSYIQKNYTGTMQNFDIDLTPFLDTRELSLAIVSLGQTTNDNVVFPELKLDWYGQEINLLNNTTLARFNWGSSAGAMSFGQESNLGTAALKTNVTAENNQQYPQVLLVSPNSNTSGDTQTGASFKSFWAIEPDIQKCSLDTTPSPTSTPKKGDINGDGKVDITDLTALLADFGKTGTRVTDLIPNSIIDVFDYSMLIANFGR